MQGQIDTSFQTLQRDFFNSGMAAQIGMNAFGVWLAIKNHADYNDGECWPGIRRLAELTGIGKSTVQRAIEVLVSERLLRVIKGQRKGNTYVARERMDIKLGDRVLCTIVLDYVPSKLKQQLNEIEQSLKVGEKTPDLWAKVEIIPGHGFMWDAAAGVLRNKIHASEFPRAVQDASQEQLENELVKRVLAIRDNRRSVDK